MLLVSCSVFFLSFDGGVDQRMGDVVVDLYGYSRLPQRLRYLMLDSQYMGGASYAANLRCSYEFPG